MHVTISIFVAIALFLASVSLTMADGQSCSDLTATEPTNDADKRNAQLCQLVEMSDIMENMAKVLGEGLSTILSAQGITVDDDDATAGNVGKRKNEYLRFGKRKNEYLRFGKRKNEYLRFGKRKNEYAPFP